MNPLVSRTLILNEADKFSRRKLKICRFSSVFRMSRHVAAKRKVSLTSTFFVTYEIRRTKDDGFHGLRRAQNAGH